MLKICLLPRGGLPLSGFSERLGTLGVEKVEKITLEEDLDTRVEFAMLKNYEHLNRGSVNLVDMVQPTDPR